MGAIISLIQVYTYIILHIYLHLHSQLYYYQSPLSFLPTGINFGIQTHLKDALGMGRPWTLTRLCLNIGLHVFMYCIIFDGGESHTLSIRASFIDGWIYHLTLN